MSPGIRVWAPNATGVEVVAGDQRTSMRRDDRGWFSAPAQAAGPDGRYLLAVDGREPLPDPRSAYQPDGVHGPSQLVDHPAFPWSDTGWKGLPLADAVIYELHLGTFTPAGTFDGAA
ncbi:MAG TPA: malto-oligosyltrehalose trehalohydrolase, partial [Candidatus Dormibacteraeota bacterium]